MTISVFLKILAIVDFQKPTLGSNFLNKCFAEFEIYLTFVLKLSRVCFSLLKGFSSVFPMRLSMNNMTP